jgi:hypothetical protein
MPGAFDGAYPRHSGYYRYLRFPGYYGYLRFSGYYGYLRFSGYYGYLRFSGYYGYLVSDALLALRARLLFGDREALLPDLHELPLHLHRSLLTSFGAATWDEGGA